MHCVYNSYTNNGGDFKMKEITRRDFIRYCGLGALGFALRPQLLLPKASGGLRASDVVQCFDENATTGSIINESVVQIMMDASIKELTGIMHVGDAWKSIFPGINEDSIITIKVNPAEQSLPSHPELVNCIVNGLSQMEFGGLYFRKNNILIWDRSETQLASAGYIIYDGNDPDTVRCFASNHSGIGYDPGTPLNVNGVTSFPSRILSMMSDYLLDVAVLKTLSISSVTLNLKNHYGSIDDPEALHDNYCNPYIPSLNQQIRDVIVPNNIHKISIIDALFGRYNGDSLVNCIPNKLLMSFDIVACDSQGQYIINEERALHGLGPLSAAHIETAALPPYNLGTTGVNLIEINNPSKIGETGTIEPGSGALLITPNPFHRIATIGFSLKHRSVVYLDLVDSTGRVVTKIHSGQYSRGSHKVSCIVDNQIPAGVFFIRYYNAGEIQTKKVTILD